jgi:hypothetical protein
VHNTQDISPDKNLPKKLNGDNSLLPQLCIDVLKPLNIDP